MTDFSFEAMIVKEAICSEVCVIGAAWTAPHVLYKPRIFPDGTKWCALLGDDLMSGIAGFGDTPAEAAAEFDKAWNAALTPKAAVSKQEDGR